MRKTRFISMLVLLAAVVSGAWATPNSIVINGTPQVGDKSISLTYYFDPANVPGITSFAPTLKVKCAADNKWDEEWLNLFDVSSGTTNISLENLGEFEAGKTYEVCFAYYNGNWVDEVFQSFVPAALATYTITLPSVENGSVVAEVNNSSVTSAAAGTTVSLVATPDAGYRLKSISGVYETSASKTETLNATAATVNGTKFRAVATARNNYGWRVYNPGSANTLTISSKDGTTIKKIELTSTWAKSRTNNMLSVTAGTLSFDGSNPSATVTINDVNATSVTISGSGTVAGTTWCISSAKIYYEGMVETAVEISDTENANVKTFTMPSSNVTISAAFIPALTLDETTDNSTALSEANGKECDVTLIRTLQTGGYNTFAVPFAISSAKMTELGITAKKLTASEFNSTTGMLSLTFADALEIEAGKPYLVKVSANVVNPTFSGVTVSSTAVPNTETEAVNFVPSLGKSLVTGDGSYASEPGSVLYLGSGNKLFSPTVVNDAEQEASYIKGFRAYFQLKGSALMAPALAFNIDFGDGETTGIISVSGSGVMVNGFDGCYDLQGRRIEGEPTQKGIYIMNGKKIIIK